MGACESCQWCLEDRLLPGTPSAALRRWVDAPDQSGFDVRHRNGDISARARATSMWLQALLLEYAPLIAYSQSSAPLAAINYQDSAFRVGARMPDRACHQSSSGI